MSKLFRVKQALNSAYAISDATREKIQACKSVTECIKLLNSGAYSEMSFAVVFLRLVDVLKTK